LTCAYNKWTLVCTVAAKLHNFLIDMNEGVQTEENRFLEDIPHGDANTILLNGKFYSTQSLCLCKYACTNQRLEWGFQQIADSTQNIWRQ
jgi:hypothetical protein